MRIVFAGSPEIATPLLLALLESPHQVVGVYTQPDKPKGRGKALLPTPIKELALSHQIPVFTPNNFKEAKTLEQLKSLKADVMVVMAYGLLLPATVLTTPQHGCINVHVSLLPKYRGASPIQAALLNGEDETGVSIMQMDKGMDTGDILRVSTCPIEKKETSQTLHDKLSTLSITPLIEVLDELEQGVRQERVKQDNQQATLANKINKQDALINWQDEASLIERQVRAYFPWPVAHFEFSGSLIKVLEATVTESFNGKPGEILQYSREGLVIACYKGALCITKLQLPGKKALDISQCFNGRAGLFKVGALLETSSS